MTAPPYSLTTYNDSAELGTVLSQIDRFTLIQYAGVPTNNVAAGAVGQFCVNLNDNSMWICTATDQTGAPTGTTWLQTGLVIVDASTSVPGIIQIATQGQVNAGSSNALAVTPATLATAYARNGANTDITSLDGTFTTPLIPGNGGTGFSTFLAALLASLPSLVEGAFLTTDGTNLLWGVPTNSVQLLASNGSLSYNTFNIVTGNGLTLTLPNGSSAKVGEPIDIVFIPSLTTGPTIVTGNSGTDLLMVAAGPLNVDNLDRAIRLTWTGSTYGWFVQGFDI